MFLRLRVAGARSYERRHLAHAAKPRISVYGGAVTLDGVVLQSRDVAHFVQQLELNGGAGVDASTEERVAHQTKALTDATEVRPSPLVLCR